VQSSMPKRSSLTQLWRRLYWRLLPVFRARSRGKRTALRTWFEAFRRISSVLSSGAADRVLGEIYEAIRALVPFPQVGHSRSDLTSRPLRFHPFYRIF